MEITFVVDHTPDGHAPNRPRYKAGETYSFDDPVAETYARKYVRRGWAQVTAAQDPDADMRPIVPEEADASHTNEAPPIVDSQDHAADDAVGDDVLGTPGEAHDRETRPQPQRRARRRV